MNNNEKILEAAIKKANENGYDFIDSEYVTDPDFWEGYSRVNFSDIIFDHDFAKAFWAEDPKTYGQQGRIEWQYHLKIMVLEEDPIQYLEKFI